MKKKIIENSPLVTEIKSCVNVIQKDRTDLEPQVSKIDRGGKINDKISEDNAAAIAIKTTNNTLVYKVKIDRRNKLYNPLNDDSTYGLTKVDKTTKNIMFKFRQVSSECFDYYINFLKKKQESFLTQAQRILL